jgi:hypothetical protein
MVAASSGSRIVRYGCGGQRRARSCCGSSIKCLRAALGVLPSIPLGSVSFAVPLRTQFFILVSLFHLDSSDCSVVPGPSEAGPETIRNGIPQKSGGYRANCTRGPYPERPQGVFPGSYTLVSSSSNGGLHCSGELAQRHQHRIRLLAELAVTRRGRARATERLHRCHGALSRCCRARC